MGHLDSPCPIMMNVEPSLVRVVRIEFLFIAYAIAICSIGVEHLRRGGRIKQRQWLEGVSGVSALVEGKGAGEGWGRCKGRRRWINELWIGKRRNRRHA